MTGPAFLSIIFIVFVQELSTLPIGQKFFEMIQVSNHEICNKVSNESFSDLLKSLF